MSATGSTLRVRTQWLVYALALAAAGATGGRLLEGGAGLLAQAAGFALVATAVLWRLWTTLFVAGRKEAVLVREGPYAGCRHPLYLGSIIAALGIGLTTRSVVMTVALPLAIAAMAVMAARREDAALAAAHGDDWREYRDSTPAFRLRWRRPAAPALVPVPPAAYRKAFLDAASFLALWLAVVVLETLRAGGAWQPVLRLP